MVNDDARRVAQARAAVVSELRRQFEARGFVEVETPVLLHQATGATARPFATHHHALDMDMYLRIATELYLKRLVVGGMEKVFEIGRIFRNEGIDSTHNPEFTMLEAYQALADYTDMMDLTEESCRPRPGGDRRHEPDLPGARPRSVTTISSGVDDRTRVRKGG